MKYMILMYPMNTRDCYILEGGREFDTIDEAVKVAIQYGTDDFWIISKTEWTAEPRKGSE